MRPISQNVFKATNPIESSRENKILTAAWNADTCSLAIATAAGGVKIYDVLPRSPSSSSNGPGNKELQPQPSAATVISIAPPPPPRPATMVLRHEIVIRIISSAQEGGRKTANRPVSSLATSSCSDSWERGEGRRGGGSTTAAACRTAAGSGILVGVAEGKHLCVWDLAAGSTLLTALSMAPKGCTVEKVLWHGPTAVVALLYHDGTGVTRVDVHQVDIGREATVPVSVGKRFGRSVLEIFKGFMDRDCTLSST